MKINSILTRFWTGSLLVFIFSLQGFSSSIIAPIGAEPHLMANKAQADDDGHCCPSLAETVTFGWRNAFVSSKRGNKCDVNEVGLIAVFDQEI